MALSQGGQLFAALTYLNDNGFAQRSGKGFVVKATAQAFFEATRTCARSAEVATRLSVDCNPSIDYSQTSGCTLCKSIQASLLKQREDLENEAAAKNPAYKKQTLSPSVEWTSKNPASGVCRFLCNACALSGIAQDQHVHLDTTCDLKADAFVSTLRRSIAASVTDVVNEHEELIKNINSGLDIKGAKEELQDTMLSIFNTKYAESMKISVISYQSLVVEPSESIVISDIQQAFNADVAETIVSRLYVNDSIYDSDSVNSQIEIYSKNSSGLDSFRSIYNQLEDSVESLWTDVRFKIIVIVALIMLILFIGILLFMFVQKNRGELAIRQSAA